MGCSSPAEPTLPPDIPHIDGAQIERWYLRQRDSEVAIAGFSGALDGRVVPTVRIAGDELELRADSNGRFSAVYPGRHAIAQVTFPSGEVVDFRSKTADFSRRSSIQPAVGFSGAVPNDLLLVTDTIGVVVRSGDQAVSRFSTRDGLLDGVRLPSIVENGREVLAGAFNAAVLRSDPLTVVVSAFRQDRVYVVDLDSGTVPRVLESREPISLQPPAVLSRSLDVDGDGTQESELTEMVMTAPQAVAVLDGWIFVAFSGFLAPRRGTLPPVFGPGFIAAWRTDTLDVRPVIARLPFDNPQYIQKLGDNIVVVCSGALDPLGTEVSVGSDGGIVTFEPESGTAQALARLGRFAPSSAVRVSDGTAWVGSLVRPELVRIDSQGEVIERLSIASHGDVTSIFRLVDLRGDLVGVPSFNDDRMDILDGLRGVLNPEPFEGGIQVGAGPPVLEGLHIVAQVPEHGLRLYALLGLSERIVPIDLAAYLGP